ncbi:MAG: hypothetical protein K0B06_13405 [Brevefilum sp.]|nr:hypothetical protein [Brevefilum sp.]
MAHILNLSKDDPVVHLKAYGGVQIKGIDQPEVLCEIDAPQLATLVEENGHVYVTVNSSCHLNVPVKSAIEIERGMGSLYIENITGAINVEKVLGNLVLINVAQAVVGKVGGNFSVRKASGRIQVDKVAGSLTVDDVQAIECGKVGGNCIVRNVQGDCRVDKAGGKCLAQGVTGLAVFSKFGGSLKAREVTLGESVKVGGNIELIGCIFAADLGLYAGGNVAVALLKDQEDLTLKLRSGGDNIKIKAHGDDLEIHDGEYEHQIGEGGRVITLAAGGSVSVVDSPGPGEDLIGDLSDRFTFEESAFSEMVQDRIDTATRRAEAKVKAAEIRLGQIQERVEKRRGFKVDLGFGDQGAWEKPPVPEQPVPPVTRPAGKKGATDEERLMILKMLQDGKITVDEAETLFKAMES